jgi:hypothetical protein
MTIMTWTCTQVEERLSDYLEHELAGDEARQLEAHAESCAQCGPLVTQVRGMLARMQELEEIPAPPYLVERIVEATMGPRKPKAGWHSMFGWMRPLLRPQFALGVAAVAFALVMVAQFVMPVRWKKTAYNPAQVVFSANRQVHLVYSRGVKYVNDLRVVYEIQSRLRPEAPPEGTPQPPVESPQSSSPHSLGTQKKSEPEGNPGHSANPARYCLATEFAPALWR